MAGRPASVFDRFQAWRANHPKLSNLTLEEWWSQRVELGLVLHGDPTFDQTDYRIRAGDTDSLNGTTDWSAALNTQATILQDHTFRVRIAVDETAGNAANNSFSIEYRHDTGGGFGSWTAISGTTPIQWALSGQYADADATTQVITTGGTFAAGDGNENDATSGNWNKASSTGEWEWALTLDSAQVTLGDTIEVRQIWNGTSTFGYTQTPSIDVGAAGTPGSATAPLISRSFTVDAATPVGAAVSTPAVTARDFLLPAATADGGGATVGYAPGPLTKDVKPAPWNVGPGLVDPSYLDLWSNIRALIGFWNDGTPYDLVSWTAATTDTGTKVSTRYGYGYATNDGSSLNAAWSSGTLNLDFSGDVPFGLMVVLDVTAYQTTSGIIAHRTGSTVAGMWQVWRSSDNALHLAYYDGTAFTQMDWSSAMPNTGQHTLVFTRRIGGIWELWVNGVSQGTVSSSGDPMPAGDNNFNIGNLEPGVGQYVEADFQLVGVWDRAFTQADVDLLADPFGLLRPNWDYAAAAGATAGTATPAVTARNIVPENVTVVGGGVTTPAVTARAFTVDATTQVGGAVAAPAVTARSFTVDAATPAGAAVTTPAVTARSFTLPAVTLAGGAVATPAASPLVLTVDQATPAGGGVATPAQVGLSFTVDAVSVVGGAATTPAQISLNIVPEDVSVVTGGAGSSSPAAITLSALVNAVTAVGPAVTTPSATSLSALVNSVTTAGPAVATPATTTATVTIPAASPAGAAETSPAVTARSFTIPDVTVVGAAVGAPDNIVLVVTIPQTTTTNADEVLVGMYHEGGLVVVVQGGVQAATSQDGGLSITDQAGGLTTGANE